MKGKSQIPYEINMLIDRALPERYCRPFEILVPSIYKEHELEKAFISQCPKRDKLIPGAGEEEASLGKKFGLRKTDLEHQVQLIACLTKDEAPTKFVSLFYKSEKEYKNSGTNQACPWIIYTIDDLNDQIIW